MIGKNGQKIFNKRFNTIDNKCAEIISKEVWWHNY